MRVGYLGPEGTFSEAAARAVYPEGGKQAYPTIPACMDAVSLNEVDVAVVPLENAIEGSVNMTLDYLIHKQQLPIIGEVTVPIEQQLLIVPERADAWENVTDIYSHPHAIAQCHDFIAAFLPDADIHYTNSTSAAAKEIADNPDVNGAAIANTLAAEKYGLTCARENIHDYDNNHTRFVCVTKNTQAHNLDLEQWDNYKTTLMVTLPSDFSGALHQVLSAFAWRKLNLTKIESRPMKTGIGNYFFIIDVEEAMDTVLLPGVIAELEALGCGVRTLGSYPCFSGADLKETTKSPVSK
ncbi:prephenate dehydratase [Alteribacillus sp. HJP-4]|uniref:prephenate dehydratase n=1 Tax=Alteribacillus sp. HJP-4 TaxID=2775394 RepID=UPI0035CD0EA8